MQWEIYSYQSPIDQAAFDSAYDLLTTALPPQECRILSDQQALLQHPAYRLRLLRAEDGNVNGLLAVWEWEHLRYVEHFAIHSRLRGKGAGGQALSSYLAMDNRPLVLEVEPAGSTPMAQRRIGFYQRLGLHLNDYPYAQPPLRAGQPMLPLRFMTWPSPIALEEFKIMRDFLYREVYDFSGEPLPT